MSIVLHIWKDEIDLAKNLVRDAERLSNSIVQSVIQSLKEEKILAYNL